MSANGLHVLMTTDAVGGVWTYALDLARGLSRHGVRTTLAVLGPPPSDTAGAAAATTIPNLSVRTVPAPLDWLAESPAEIVAASAAVSRLAAEVGADLLHLNSPALAAKLTVDIPVVGACHSCLATWWDAMRGGPLPLDFAWRTAILAQGYDAATRLVAPSRSFAEATARLYRRAPPTVVHNGRLAPTAHSTAAADPVFTAGRLWDDAKNLATLDRVAARLPVPVVAAGPLMGPNGTAVAVQHVQAVGALSAAAIEARLAGRPIFVSLARYEPFGLAVLEAAQAGCALVLSDIPTFRELWDGVATFVPAEDDAAAASAITTLLHDRPHRTASGDAAQAHARRYDGASMVAGMLSIYAEAADRRGVAA